MSLVRTFNQITARDIGVVGGILSHGAIVAREYGIPAVMSVRGATQTIRDGMRVTVEAIAAW